MNNESLESTILKQDVLNVVTLIARNMSTNLGLYTSTNIFSLLLLQT